MALVYHMVSCDWEASNMRLPCLPRGQNLLDTEVGPILPLLVPRYRG